MREIFVDTSAFYAFLDGTDSFCPKAKEILLQAASERWRILTTNYIVHESWAIIQNRLGWKALDAFLDQVLPICEVTYVDKELYALGAARCKQAANRSLSLTDCISFEFMRREKIRYALAQDQHFVKEGIQLL